MQRSANSRAGASPAKILNIFNQYIFPRCDYASCLWIFRIFFYRKRRFFGDTNTMSPGLTPDASPLRPYGEHFKTLNKVFMQCMRLVIGAHGSSCAEAVLVRLGVMPLRYMLAFRASLWFLKIISGESDKLLLDQWKTMCTDTEAYEFSCFYRGCDEFIKRLNTFSDIDILSCPRGLRKKILSNAIFCDLSIFWSNFQSARVTRRIHENWHTRSVHSSFVTRYSLTVYHNLALGRGPLRAITRRDKPYNLKCCRHGCGCLEDLHHLLLVCKFVRNQRKAAEKVLKAKRLKLSIKNMLSVEEVREIIENLILTFLA